MKQKQFIFALVAMLLSFVPPVFAQVAKVGNTEYATIDEAISKWTNGTTLTLLDNVTLSDVIELSSTEHHILDLGTYTMTAASKKDAIQIVNNGRSKASYALDITADATNPGGITATGKAVVKTTGKSGVQDRPIIRFYGGVFNGSNVVSHSGSNGTNCPQFWFYGGVFNGTIYANRALFQFYGGTFNGALQISVDSSAYALIAGGRFSKLSNLYGSSLNSSKFTIGSAKGVYDRGIYVDAEGYYVITSAPITEVSAKYPAVKKESYNSSNYFYYSAAAANGMFYEVASMAGTGSNVTKYEHAEVVEELDNNAAVKDFTPELPSEVKTFEVEAIDIEATAEATTKVTFNVEPKNASGAKVSNPSAAITFRLPVPAAWSGKANVYHGSDLLGAYPIKEESGAKYVEVSSSSFSEFSVEAVPPVAQIGEQKYATLAEAVNAAQNGDEIVIIADIELAETIEFPADKTITLNLNDKTISAADKNVVKNSGAALTIKSGTIKRTGTVAGYAVNVVSGTLEVEDVTIVGGLYTSGTSLVATNTNISQASASRHAIYAYNCAVTINSGTYHNDNAGNATIFAYGSSVITIEDGTFSIDNGKQTFGWTSSLLDANAGGKYVIKGGEFKGHFRVQANSSMEINGGTFANTHNEAYNIIGTAEVKGGTFTDAAAQTFAKNNIADDYKLGEDGKVVYVPVVAKIGETKYETLDAAFAAATEGQTITLMADATPALTSQRAITKAAVIDLGGKTMTLTEDDLYFGTTTFKNGTIVVDPSVKPSTAVFWMFANQTLTFDNVKVVATGVTGTYLIGLDGNNSDLNLLNGSEILVENSTALDLDIICVNATTGNDIKVENSKVNVTNLDGRVFFRGNYTVKDSEVNLAGITKAGFRIEAGQKLSIEGTSKVNIEGEPRDGGIHMTDLSATYTKAETATVNATVNEPKVAKVGENTYRTLAQAVAAVEDGGTITLIANETFTKNNRYNNGGYWDGLGYSGDKSFTIDLANFTISQDGALNDYLMWFKNDGAKGNTITLKNGTLDAGTTAYSALATSSSNAQKITVNLENINVINNNSNGAALKIRGGSELNVKAGTIITGQNSYLGIETVGKTTVVNIYEGAEIYQNGTSSYCGCLAGASGNGTINVYGGKGQSKSGGFIAMTSGGTINIEGGEWTANTDGTYANGNKSVLVAQSDKQYNAGAGNSIVNVTGGTFKGGYNCYGNKAGDAQINISGGNFNSNPSAYVKAGYVATEAAGIYTVVEAPAYIDGKASYASLAAAYEAAVNGDVIVLNESVTTFPVIKKAVTFKGGKENAAVEINYALSQNFTAIDGKVRFENLTFNKPLFTEHGGNKPGLSIEFDGCNFNVNSEAGYGILIGTSWSNSVVKGLKVNNCNFKYVGTEFKGGYMLYVQCVNEVTITNNTIDGNNLYRGAIHLGDATEHATVATVSDNTIKNFCRGVMMGNRVVGSSATISGNTFDNINYSDKDSKPAQECAPIFIHSNATAEALQIALTNNKVENCANPMIYSEDTDLIKYYVTEFTGNTVAGAAVELANSYNAPNQIFPVATINDAEYFTLQAAVNAVKNGETITLTSDVTENVTLTEKVGLYYTIDGNGKQFNGSISVNSLSDTENNRRITIKNIKFVDTADANVDFISSVNTNHYPRLTVEGCTFTGSGNDGDVAIRLKSSHSVVIKDCTGTGLHSFLQNTSGWNLTIEKVTVTDSKSAFALGTVQGVTVKDCEVKVQGYGIRLDAQYNNNAVLESNKVEAFIPVVVRKASVNSNVTVQGTNEMTATNSDGLWCAVGTSEYEANGTMPTAATADVKIVLTDANLNAAGVYGSYYDALTIHVGAQVATTAVTRDIYVATMDEAVANAKSINAGSVTYKVYGEVELTTGGSHGILDLGKNVIIEGADATAKLTIVGGGVPDIKGVTFKNIILADKGTYLPTANEFMYQNYIDCTFENVTFVDGIRLSGTSSIKDSKVDANTTNEYAIWLDEGEFTMTGTTVVGGADAYGLVKSDAVSKITITGNTFQYLGEANKEALNVKEAVIVAENNQFIDCVKGILPADKTNYTDDSKTTAATDAIIAGNNTVTVYYAAVGEQKFETLLEAINAVQDGQTIELIRDVTMDYNARDAYETQAQNVVINGNGNTLTLNQKNSDWASFGLANNSKLVLNNMTIEKTGYGDTNGAWNTHAIIFSCPVEMTDVIINNGIAVQAGATLTNVTINEANGYYGLWVNGNGQSVTMNGGAINATNGGRGIKIADQYIDAPAQVTLSVDGTVFNTAKKAAVLVSSTAGAQIAATNVNIANVAEDSENFVWVDEDWAQHFANVEVTGATVRAEGVAAFTAAITANGAVQAYYKTLAEAINAAEAGATVDLLADVTLAGGYADAAEGLRIEKEITLNGNGHTIDCGNFQKGIRVYNPSNVGDFNVNFNNVKVVNKVANGRCIDTRSGNINLKVNSSTLIATNGNSQPLTIGGNDPVHRVTLNETTIDAGTSGYAVISFVSTNVDIQGVNNSTISGYAAFYLKGDAKTTNLLLGQGVYTGTNNHAVESGLFGTVVLEGDNNVVNLMGTNATVKAIANNTAPQAAFLVRGTNNIIKVTKESAKIITEGNAYEAIVDTENASTTKFIDMGVERKLVAENGGCQFYSFEDAVRFAGNEGTIKIVNDFELAEAWTVAAGQNITLDLNGKTICQTKECTASYEMICNKGNLTITDSSDAKDGKLSFKDTSAGDPSFGWGSYTVRNEGNLVVENGTIEHLGEQTFATHCIMALYQYSGSTTINGGTISTPNYRSARLWKGEMTINGGTFDGQVWAQAVDNSANLVINGGTFEPNGNDASAVFVTNSTYDVDFAVTGGTFNGKVGCSDATKVANAITGGKFNAAAVAGTSKDLIAFGYEFGAVDADGYQAVYNDENVLYIETLADLKAFRDAVNSGANYYAGVNVVLAADIDMAGENWVGIGTATAEHGFMGNFDGQGYKIKNLTITNPALDSDGYAYAGLFGVTEGKDKDNQNTIKNLTIENVTINTTGQIAAAAIAYPYYTIVDNVKVCGNIAITGGNYTAGVLAYTRRCVNASNLSIVGNDGSFVKGNQTVGGVISDIQMNGGLTAVYKNFSAEGITVTGEKSVGGISGIIATQTLNGATVKNVTLNSSDARVGIVAGCLGGTSTISNVTYENVTGAATLIGASYDNAKAVAAKIGDTYYATLEAALAAQGNEVELLATYEVAAGETKTLDLKGKTVTMVYTAKATKNHTMVSNSGNLTIESSVEGGKLSYTYAGENIGTSYSVNAVTSNPGSVLTVKSGAIENLTYDNSVIAYAIDGLTNGGAGDVTVNIEGGVITSKRQAVRIFANSTTNTGALNISGGDFTGRVIVQNASAKANKAALNITGGTFNANDYKTDVLYVGGSSSATIDINATVSGGTFNGEITETNVAGFISGGTYANPVVAQYCATGYMPNKNANGTYGVVLAQDVVASINGVTYETLASAITASKAGETITLLQDVKENVTISKNLTIDGADKTITGMITTDGKSLKVTIKNVHFDGNNRTINYAMRADDDLNLVVDNCSASNYLYGFLYANKSNDKIVVKNVTVKNCAEYGAYLVAFNNATFENFTVKGNTKYGIAVANSGARTVNLKNVTFEGAEQPLHINELGTAKVTFNFSGINDMSKAEYYTSEYVNVVAVAQVGTKVCGSLQDAVVAAKDGETVKVLADVNMTTANFVTQVDGYATLVNVAGKSVTIDLNGKKVTVNAAATDLVGKAKSNMLMSVFHADPNGTLTLTDSSAEGTGTVELFANDATVYGLIVSENANDKNNPGKIIINGGNYKADKLGDSMIFADINEVITVNAGNFHLGNVGTGDNGKPWIFNTTGQNQIHINVNGGTYNANVGKQYYRNEVKLGEGLATADNGNGTWTVVPAVATVGKESFGTIQEAIDAAQDGETVKLIADVALDTKKSTIQVDNLVVLFNVKGKAVTFDLNGKKIDVNASAANLDGKMLAGVFSADVEGDFTITDSSAEGTGAVTVTVNDAKVYSVFISENAGDKTKSGKMTVHAGNFTTVGKVANAMIFADTDKVVTINGGTFICDGVSASENYPWLINTYGNNEIQVTVNGGTFNYDINHQYRPFEVFVPENLAVKNNGDGTWTVVPAEAYVTEMLGAYVNEPGSREHKVGYATLAEAIAAAKTGETVTMVKNVELTESIVNTKTVTLNLNGKTVVATDKATGSYAMITNKGNLTIEGDGAITLKATNNRGWNAYSSVISNTVGGKLTVNGGTIQHLGGTDMAYGIDNLTNGKGTYAETIINGGVVKSTYRAVRQFLNGIEAQNILTVNGGTIEGANKSIWMQDPSKNANTGKLTVSEDASLNGDVYLTVTAGSTEWPVEVSIAAAALEGESKVLSSNVPAGYAVTNFDGVYSVEKLGGIGSKLTIVDGEYENFSIELDVPAIVDTLTYKRNFSTEGNWYSFYLPFEIPVEQIDLDKYDIAYFNDIHWVDRDDDGVMDTPEMTLEVIKIKGGTLKANHPYVIKPKTNDALELNLVLSDAKLHSTSEKVDVEFSSAYVNYVVSGTYSRAYEDELGGGKECIVVTGGELRTMGTTARLAAFRAYMTMENKDGSPVIMSESAGIRIRVAGEKDPVTGIITPIVEEGSNAVKEGIFDLMGRPVKTPEKGKIYIMNGKKVLF